MTGYGRFLVTGANGDIADCIGRILRERFPDARIDGADAIGEWPGRASFDAVYNLPYAGQDGFIEALCQLAEAQRYDLILPTTEAELIRFSAETVSVEDLPLLINPPDLIRHFTDKLATAEWLMERGLPGLPTRPLAEASADDLPVFVKPRRGHGSRGGEHVTSARRLEELRDGAAVDMVAQAFIPDDEGEFTCALVRQGAEQRAITFRRWLQGGLTGRAVVEANDAISAALAKLAGLLDGDAFLNIQLRMAGGRPHIFEINPRFSSTVMMRHLLGFQDVVWAIEGRRGIVPPPYSPPVGAQVYRLSREVVVAA